LRAEADSGAFPGAVLAVGRHGRLALLAAVGRYGKGEADDPRPVEPTTIYDLASLTKVVGLTSACMLLVDEGKLALDAPVQRYLPEFRGDGKEAVTIRHLLTHSSGLPAWRPLYQEADSRATALWVVNTTPLATPPGQAYVYSDLGAIVLTEVVERITREPLDRFLQERVFRPLGMPATRYLPPTRPPRTTPATATGCCAARCTTKTPAGWAGSPVTPACFPTPSTCPASRQCC